MNSWTAKFIGGPLEGQLIVVDSKVVRHIVTSRYSDKVKNYWYRRSTHLGEDVWAYIVDNITEEDKPR